MSLQTFLLTCIILLISASDASGQVEVALEHVEHRRWREARAMLQDLVSRDALAQDDRGRPLALYLGQALHETDGADAAASYWHTWLRDHASGEPSRVVVADAFIRGAFTDGLERYYNLAAQAYLDMLEAWRPAMPDVLRDAIMPHLRVMALVHEEGDPQEGLPVLSNMRGEKIASWWRRRDPTPGTPRNERVEEHLERVAHAQKEYANNRAPRGFDERGDIYVRLGPPRNRAVLRMVDRGVMMSSMNPRRSGLELPANEFWTYNHIDLPVYFLFINRRGSYELSMPADLVPESLRSGVTRADDFDYATTSGDAVLEAWSVIYGQLALLHPDFVTQAMEVDDLLAGRNMGQSRRSFLLNNRMRFRRMDEESADRRDRVTPVAFSSAESQISRMPIAVRTARFRETDGSTRLDIFWSHPPGSLDAESVAGRPLSRFGGRSLVQLSIAQRDSLNRPVDIALRRYELSGSTDDSYAGIQMVHVPLDDRTSTVGLQWDRYQIMGEEEGRGSQGPRLQTGSTWVESVPALASDSGRLEMSDAMPVIWAPDSPTHELPYPFSAPSPELELALRFEVYDVALQADGVGRYEVTYQVERLDDEGQRVIETRTSAASSFETRERTSEDVILIESGAWRGSRPVRITLTARDVATGYEVTRSISFSRGN